MQPKSSSPYSEVLPLILRLSRVLPIMFQSELQFHAVPWDAMETKSNQYNLYTGAEELTLPFMNIWSNSNGLKHAAHQFTLYSSLTDFLQS
jgi:hypothetical protein